MLKLSDLVSGPDGAGALVCPGCGGDHLHNFRVEVFERDKEDGEGGLHVVAEKRTVLVDSDQTGNPSRRRNGVRLWFLCEGCVVISALDVMQQKGNTLIAMAAVAP